ncbi:MAG: hypothetical protein FWE98_05445 [Oscillospiraceae bacterium]|nr:hypothetical protein [Oscillospiraceae bacterium]
MDIMDSIAKQLPRMQKAVAAHYKRKARVKPPPPLPDGVWDALDTPGPYYTVGFGSAPFTPTIDEIKEKPCWLAGYGTNRPATSIHSDIRAGAIYIDDNTGRGALLLLSLDCVGLLRDDMLVIRKRLANFCERTGCRAVNVFSTHCHAGPDTMGIYGRFPASGRDPAFMERLYWAASIAAEQAWASRKNGRLYAGSIEADGIQKDIRPPEVFCKTLTRLRFAPDDGSKETWLLNFAAHPEVMDQRNRAVSADYVHFLREKIEAERGAKVIYFNGAIGGMITPMEINPEDFLESCQWAGEEIAKAAMRIETERELVPLVNLIRQDFYIELANVLFMLGGLIGLLPRERHATGEGPLGISVLTEMNYIEIGDVHILTVPGELFPELQLGGYLPTEEASMGGPEKNPLPLRELADDPGLIVFGLGSDELGYILPPNDYMLDDEQPFVKQPIDRHGRKHYEETNSAGPMTAVRVAQAFERILGIIGRL